jgi:hypothetical protein
MQERAIGTINPITKYIAYFDSKFFLCTTEAKEE